MHILNKKGFTLMELMVVVIIIGILSLVAMPYYKQHLEKEKTALGISSLRMFADSVERYMALHNENVPTDLSLLDVDIDSKKLSGDKRTYSDGNFIYSVVTGSDGKHYIKGARITGEYTLGYNVSNNDYDEETGTLICISNGTNYCQDRLNMECANITL